MKARKQQRLEVRVYVSQRQVTVDGKPGVWFAQTEWGRGRVRWKWVRFEDGSEKAFKSSKVVIVG